MRGTGKSIAVWTLILLVAFMVVGHVGAGYAQTEDDGSVIVPISGASGRSVRANVWFASWTWTAPATGPVTFDTRGTDFDTVLTVVDDATYEQVASNFDLDDFTFASEVRFTAQQGQAYSITAIRADGFDPGTIVLSWQTSLSIGEEESDSTSGAQATDPPWHGTVYIDPDIITEADPTTFQGFADAGQHQRTVFDRRTGQWGTVNVYVFEARYDGGLLIEALVNPEFGSVSAAREVAVRYARMVGQLPTDLRVGVRTLTIHKGDHLLGGGNHDILIHQDHAERSMQRGFLEEELMHEATHSSLDADHATAAEWLAAQQADGNFISTYARDHPAREDIAESFSAYFVVRYRSNRVPESTVQKIERTMPNRIAYFDSLALDMYPTWSLPDYGATSHGLGTTLSYVVAGTTDVLAEIEYLGYAMHDGRWVLVVFNDPPVPENDPCHGMTHEYWDLETGNWVA